jgi:hypothetical protein
MYLILDRLYYYFFCYGFLLSPFLNVYFYSKFSKDHKWKKSMVTLGIVIQIVRLIMYGLLIFTNTEVLQPIKRLIFYWLTLTSLVSPLINIYWIVNLVKSVPRKRVIALISMAIYLLFAYRTYSRFFPPF